MKAKAKIMAVLLCAAAFAPVCFAGCGGQQNAEESKAPESSVQESSQAESSAPESSKPEESSKPQESSVDEKQVKTDQAKKDIAVLLEYKKNIPAVKEIDASYIMNGMNPEKMRENSTGKIHYVDSVIRDINSDGKMELVIKYDCQMQNNFMLNSCFLYEVIKVVDGKAVATDRLKDEAWFVNTLR